MVTKLSKKNKFAKNLSSLLSFNNNIAIVPYSKDRTTSTIMLKFENSTREIKLPNPDYHIHLTIRGFKNILFKKIKVNYKRTNLLSLFDKYICLIILDTKIPSSRVA